jgi:hypothetical protein
METKKLVLVLVVSSLLVLGSVSQARIIMDATESYYYDNGWVTVPGLHNGGLTANGTGDWYQGHTPAGWIDTLEVSCYQTAYQWTMISSSYGGAVNNTGEIVNAGEVFTVSADLGGSAAGKLPTVNVWATQNIDGTGASTLLATVNRLTPAGDPSYTLFNVVGMAGAPATAGLAGYYVQVQLVGGGAYYDNIVVTSVPEPATLALLGLGGLLLRKKR